jgi:hypothetical protein
MRRVLIAIAMLLVALTAGSCAMEPIGPSGPSGTVDLSPVPLGEDDVVVLGPIRRSSPEEDPQGSDPLGWFFDKANDKGKKNGRWDAGEKVWQSRGSMFDETFPSLRQDIIEGVERVVGIDFDGNSHDIQYFVLDNGSISVLGVHTQDTLSWLVKKGTTKEAAPIKKAFFDDEKVAEELTMFTTAMSGDKSQLRIYVGPNPVNAKTLILYLQ